MSTENVNPLDLSTTAVGFRVFITGQTDQIALDRLRGKVTTIDRLRHQLEEAGKRPTMAIITTDDLPESGIQVLSSTGLMVIKSEQARTKSRAKHARQLLGETSSPEGISYADMLNSLAENLERTHPEVQSIILVSPSLAGDPEIMARQIVSLKKLYDFWQKVKPGRLAAVGSLIEGEHDQNLAQEVINGTNDLNLENLGGLTPNNSLSIVPTSTRFSGITDNGLTGTINVENKAQPIGGNEDYLNCLAQMLFYGKDCVLLVDPLMPGERQAKILVVDAKYSRRSLVQRLYAERLIKKAIMRGRIKSTDEIEDIIDRHLFLAKMGSHDQPEIVLTARQRLKDVSVT